MEQRRIEGARTPLLWPSKKSGGLLLGPLQKLRSKAFTPIRWEGLYKSGYILVFTWWCFFSSGWQQPRVLPDSRRCVLQWWSPLLPARLELLLRRMHAIGSLFRECSIHSIHLFLSFWNTLWSALNHDCWAEFTEDHSAAAERVLYRGREPIISEMQKYTQ